MKQIQTTAKYIQGKDIYINIGEIIKKYGDSVFVLAGNSAFNSTHEVLKKTFSENGLKYRFEKFNGETTYDEVKRIQDLIENDNFEIVIGLGGGKVLDTAKCVGFFEKKKVIMFPTIASSDAPCSSVAVMYSDAGAVVNIEYFERNPDLVAVDSQVIADSPSKFLKSGIGDALSTFFDARINFKNGNKNVFGTNIAATTYEMAKISYRLILENARKAIWSNDMNLVTDELEAAIEAATYLSGVGFENCGISCSHSIHDALTEIDECHKFLHGEKVAFGTFCELVMEKVSEDELNIFMNLLKDLDLPLTLKQLDLVENKKEKIWSVMDVAFQPQEDSVYHMPTYATKESVYATILLADRIGTEFLGK